VTRFGAAGDGTTDCTAAFRRAIEACHRRGGRVLVPPGAFLTGAIHLRSGMGAEGVPVGQRQFGAGHYLRPNMVHFYRYSNVLVSDVTIVDDCIAVKGAAMKTVSA
jgi:polygalacturonase